MPQTAVIVSSGIAHRQVDISKLLISRSDSPHIRCAPRPGLARGRIARPIWMHHIPGPAELARDSIKAANDARGRPAILAVKDLMPCNNDTPDNGRSEEHTSELQSQMRTSYADF